MTISERIREAAIGPTPSGNTLSAWVGANLQFDAMRFKENCHPWFYAADEATQRTFLLLVACALESK